MVYRLSRLLGMVSFGLLFVSLAQFILGVRCYTKLQSQLYLTVHKVVENNSLPLIPILVIEYLRRVIARSQHSDVTNDKSGNQCTTTSFARDCT